MATDAGWLRDAFHRAAEKFPDVAFAALRPTKFDNWPLVPTGVGGNSIGLAADEWRELRDHTGAVALYQPVRVTWLKIEGEVWHGGFFTRKESPNAEELYAAAEELDQLACQACDEFGIPETIQVSDGCLKPGLMARWLEFVCAMPHVQVRGKNLGLAIRRLSNVFRASARAVDLLMARTVAAPTKTSDGSFDAADDEFVEALAIAKLNLLTRKREFAQQMGAAVPGKDQSAIWKTWNARKRRLEENLKQWHEAELAKYGWTIGHAVARDDKNFAKLAEINRELKERDLANYIVLGIGKHCRSCGAERPQIDWGGDGHCDRCAKQWNDSLIPLLRDFATNPSRLNSYAEWPSIQHYACELFAHPTFTDETLTRLKNWLIAEHGLTENQVHELFREKLVQMLQAAVESSREAGGADAHEGPANTLGEQLETVVHPQSSVPEAKSLADNATKTNAPAEAPATPAAATDSSSNMPIEPQELATSHEPKQFSGGTMMFFADRVELCSVDICSGSRSKTRRRILEALRNKRSDGTYVSYSSEELAGRADLKGGQNAVAGAIRDLRDNIEEALRVSAGIACARTHVILSGGPGYRFSELITVQHENQAAEVQIADTAGEGDVPNVPNGDVPNVPDVPDDAAEARRAWILHRLALGDRLRAPAVAKKFACSGKTAKRDLQSLKNEGRIEFVGARRTGHYRLISTKQSSG